MFFPDKSGARNLTERLNPLREKSPLSGSNSVVECNLAKVEVAGSNPVSRSIFLFPCSGARIRRHSQAVRQRSAKPPFSSSNLDAASKNPPVARGAGCRAARRRKVPATCAPRCIRRTPAACALPMRPERPAARNPKGWLAQLVEHRPYKPGATGSSPVPPTKGIYGLSAKTGRLFLFLPLPNHRRVGRDAA